MARAHNWEGRTRMLRPEINSDERVAELTPMHRLLFVGLLVFSTASGAIPACAASIGKAVFPHRAGVDVAEGLAAIERAGLIKRDGESLQIVALTDFVQTKTEPRHHASEARRRALKRNAMPKWADRDAVRAVYAEAKALIKFTGKSWHVDHIIPLAGKTVCGLHVHTNLRIIPGRENLRKSNKFEVEA